MFDLSASFDKVRYTHLTSFLIFLDRCVGDDFAETVVLRQVNEELQVLRGVAAA